MNSETISFAAFESWSKELKEEGLPDEAVATMLGAAVRSVIDQLMTQMTAWIGEQAVQDLEKMSPEEQEQKIEAVVLENAGVSLVEYREQLAEKLIAEYKSLA